MSYVYLKTKPKYLLSQWQVHSRPWKLHELCQAACDDPRSLDHQLGYPPVIVAGKSSVYTLW